MRVKNPFLFFLLLVFSLAGISCGGSDPSGREVEAEEQFEVTLLRVSVLDGTGKAAFANIGTDPLVQGKVEVEEMGKNEVKVEVRGAAANATYTVRFCSFNTPAAGIPPTVDTSACVFIGSLTTDAAGNAEVEFAFPQTGGFAGVFVLTRKIDMTETNEFVTGFTVPTTRVGEGESENEGEEDENFEVNLQPVSVINGGLGSGFGPAGNDPLSAGRVEVEEGQEVEVQVAGASANVTYAAEFCRFGVGPSGCVAVGSFSTDAQGNAEAKLNFPVTGAFDGVFLLTRTIGTTETKEFVTAFRVL